ncbi:MAG: hypothetical protein KL863_14915 [Rhizobium sp.]|nr:hypothetical protein [Rhizobium sp.]
MKGRHRRTTALACLLAAWLSAGAAAGAGKPTVPDGIDTPEEAAAFLLFGLGFRDICQSAYGDSSCPTEFGKGEVRVTDKIYKHLYALSADNCTLSADLTTLADGSPLKGVLHLDRIEAIDMRYADRYEKSVEYAFTFSGDSVNASPGQETGAFVFFHEYADSPAFDHAAHAQAELEAMRVVLGEYRQRHCPARP